MKNQRWSGTGEKMHLLYTITGLNTFIPCFPNVVLCHSKKQKCAQPLRFNFSKQRCKYIQGENFTIQFFRRLYWWNMLWWVLGKPPHIYLFNLCSHWLLLIFRFHQTWNNRTKKCTPNPEGEIFRKSISEGTITLLLPAASENKSGKGNGGISGVTRTGTHEDPLGREDRSAWSVRREKQQLPCCVLHLAAPAPARAGEGYPQFCLARSTGGRRAENMDAKIYFLPICIVLQAYSWRNIQYLGGLNTSVKLQYESICGMHRSFTKSGLSFLIWFQVFFLSLCLPRLTNTAAPGRRKAVSRSVKTRLAKSPTKSTTPSNQAYWCEHNLTEDVTPTKPRRFSLSTISWMHSYLHP